MEDWNSNVRFSNPAKPTYKECLAYFHDYLQQYAFLTPGDLEGLDKYWEYFSMSKKNHLVMPGEVCRYVVFLCKGAIKHFSEDQSGKYIINFSTEGSFCVDIRSFEEEKRATDGFVCVKSSYGLKISLINFKKLISERPAFGQLYIQVRDGEIQMLVNRVKSFQSTDAKGRYELLMKENSSVFNYFSLQDISNYLGITPETLSRLRSGKNNLLTFQ